MFNIFKVIEFKFQDTFMRKRDQKIDYSILKQLISKKTNILVFLQGIAGTVPWAVFFVYLTDYLAQDIGYSVQMASLVVLL